MPAASAGSKATPGGVGVTVGVAVGVGVGVGLGAVQVRADTSIMAMTAMIPIDIQSKFLFFT